MSRMSTREAIGAGWVVCPSCHGALAQAAAALTCSGCDAVYPVTEDDIPWMATPEPGSDTIEVREFWTALHAAIDGPAAALVQRGELNGLLDRLQELFEHREHLAVREMPIGSLAGRRVLEIGSGGGAHAALFNRRGAEMVALDVTPDRVVATARKLDDGATPSLSLQGDARRLPFPDAWFDIVYSNGVLHHSPDIRASVSEVYRVLKPGGRAVAMLYARHSFLYQGVLFPIRGVLQGKAFGGRQWLGAATEWMSSTRQTVSNPWTTVFSARDVRRLFAQFDTVTLRKNAFTFDQIPVVGKLIGRLAGRWTGLNPAGILLYGSPWRNETRFELWVGRHVGWGLNIAATKEV
jgi:ubiquinone/menaquinone biosynthesis C-methylase UbiE/uncharacterized protein YbaR (Trm112 family)